MEPSKRDFYLKTSYASKSSCAHLRAAYESCYNRCNSDPGRCVKEPCLSEWQKYRDCVCKRLDDPNLRRFLEGECGYIFPQDDGGNPVQNTVKKLK